MSTESWPPEIVTQHFENFVRAQPIMELIQKSCDGSLNYYFCRFHEYLLQQIPTEEWTILLHQSMSDAWRHKLAQIYRDHQEHGRCISGCAKDDIND